MRIAGFLVLLLMLAACGGGDAGRTTGGGLSESEGAESEGAESESEGAESEGTEGEGSGEPIAEVPYTAAQIRDATPAGRTYVFRFREGARTRHERWVFETVTATGYTSSTTPIDEPGEALGAATREEGTWADLERHAHFPAATTEVAPAQLTLPIGAFRCRLYTVTSTDAQGRAVVARYWFANDLPGAPVRMIREIAGATEVEMQLVAHQPPL